MKQHAYIAKTTTAIDVLFFCIQLISLEQVHIVELVLVVYLEATQT